MNPEELERGKCYRAKYGHNLSSICLFQFKSIDVDLTDLYGMGLDFIKAISIEGNATISTAKFNYFTYNDLIEEVDESILDKAIKQFNMDKAAISAIINQDKSNETQGNTAQGDYQLP